ncbi:MAG TPA: helix-turn-helix domain-containing protein [Terracidiphilus sp.]|nr:helix-turn-helix domain-containing protein [Terracidiphilus sp.]
MALQTSLSIYEVPDSSPIQNGGRNGKVLTFVPEQLLETPEAASAMKIHPKTLQKMARRREIRGIRVGKHWRFRASDIQDWIDRQ